MSVFQTKPNNISALRGLAIMAVLINHYCNSYITGNQSGYANGVIGIFFFLSGWLAFRSIDHTNQYAKITQIGYYYTKRILRIYPLLWIYLGIYSFNNEYGILAWSGFLTPGLAWFVSAILQCYLFGFIFYSAIGTKSIARNTAYAILFLIITIATYYTVLPASRPFVYRGIPAGHIVLFCLGMISSKYNNPITENSKKIIIISLIAFVVSIYTTREEFDLFHEYTLLFGLIYCVSTSIFCSLCINYSHLIVNGHFISFLGNYSYGIYLFHIAYYSVLSKVGIIHTDSLISILLTVCLFPIFLFIISRFESLMNQLANTLQITVANSLEIRS